MGKVIFQTGSFEGEIGTDSDGNISLKTHNNEKSIHIGAIKEFTGSEERTKDPATGNLTYSQKRKSDGTFEEVKYDPSVAGRKIETKIKDPDKGKEFIRSGSATSNQIEFQQNADGALIIVSGGNPGFTAFMNDIGDRAIRARGDVYLSGSRFCSSGVAMNGGSLDYYIQQNHIGALGTTQTFGDSNGNGYLMVSHSGDTRVSKDLIVDGGITANSLIVTHFTSSFVTASTLTTEGSNVFGDTSTDTHTFNGDIIAQNNISSSGGTITGDRGSFDTRVSTPQIASADTDTVTINDNLIVNGEISSSGAIYGKQIQHTYHQFDNPSSATNMYIPAPGGYISEGNSINYYRKWLAPYKGKLKKIVAYAENDCGTTRISLYTNGVFSGYDEQSLGATTAVEFNTFTGGLSGNPNFAKHALLSIGMDPANIPGEVNLVCTWEYEIDS